jgi:hypothetical protein
LDDQERELFRGGFKEVVDVGSGGGHDALIFSDSLKGVEFVWWSGGRIVQWLYKMKEVKDVGESCPKKECQVIVPDEI